MKLNTRLSVAAILAAALVVPTASVGADSALASQTHPASSPAAASSAGRMIAHVTGTAAHHQHLRGTFMPKHFSVRHGRLMVTGVLHGVVTGKGSPTHFTTTRTFPVRRVDGVALRSLRGAAGRAGRQATPSLATGQGSNAVNAAAPACGILNLTLGPLDLNLLGLQVHLDRVVLNVTAQSGAGNLLGNLLCSVAGLLDGGPLAGLLGQLSSLLNQILGALSSAA